MQPEQVEVPAGQRAVYHPQTGKAYIGEPVDCRELMQLHGYTSKPLVVAVSDDEKAKMAAEVDAANKRAAAAEKELVATGMPIAGLRAALTDKGVSFEPEAAKAELIQLYVAS